MKKYLDVLKRCPLFGGINDHELDSMLNCLEAIKKSYQKGSVIFAEGDPADQFGIVLQGNVQITRTDYYGNRSILTSVGPSQLFGESFACAGLNSLPVDATATESTQILLINAHHITHSCCKACPCHGQMIFNLLNVVAEKNLLFHQKIEITSKRTTKEKLMTYLLLQAKNAGSNTFTIPYDRQELADYLEVERSGLSAQISKLQKEGALKCRKSTFTLL